MLRTQSPTADAVWAGETDDWGEKIVFGELKPPVQKKKKAKTV